MTALAVSLADVKMVRRRAVGRAMPVTWSTTLSHVVFFYSEELFLCIPFNISIPGGSTILDGN